MSRVLLSGDNQVTWPFGKHGGWSKGIDIVRFENRLEKNNGSYCRKSY